MTTIRHLPFRSRRLYFAAAVPLVFGAGLASAFALDAMSRNTSLAPDESPRVVTPAPLAPDAAPIPAPSDAIVLFDGASLDAWRADADKPAAWSFDRTLGGAMHVTPGKGGLFTKQSFGDVQLHIEFATPADVKGDGQERGNSGVYLQGRYEVQVLDSFNSPTYSNGQCGAIYAQHPPLVNACRKPGEWQTYDIIFLAARFDDAGTRTAPARMTVIHNGVLIHDHAELNGETTAAPNKEGKADGPLYLQDHGNPVRYRNIWIRPLSAK